MMNLPRRAKGLLLGSRIRSDESHQILLPNQLAASLFTANMLSSVAYVPQFVLMVLAVAGASAITWGLGVGLAIAFLLLLVVGAQHTIIRIYPGGGGDYQVVKHNLGYRTAASVAAGFMVDYALTVALCLSMMVHMFAGIAPGVMPYTPLIAAGILVILLWVSMRGYANSAWATLLPTGFFILVLIVLLVGGAVRAAMGNSIVAVSGTYGLTPSASFADGVSNAPAEAVLMLLAGGIAIGATALSGVESVNNGMEILNKPQNRNASRILALSASTTFGLMVGVVVLSWASQVAFVSDPLRQLPGSPAGYVQQPLLVQLASAVFPDYPFMEWVVMLASALVLMVAAIAVFISFPSLTMHVAKDGFLPQFLSYRGRRLTHNGGIFSLAILVVLALALTNGQPRRLLELYALGSLWAFLVAQIAMVKHWIRHLRAARTPRKIARARSGMALAIITALLLAMVLLLSVIFKFIRGGWASILAIVIITFVLLSFGRHYAKVKKRLADARWQGMAPSRTHALVIVFGLHLPTRRALAYARAARPDAVEAITINIDDAKTRKLVEAWTKSEMDIPLKVLEAPYRTILGPVVRYIRRIRAHNPRDVVNVYIPQLVVKHWWESIAHNEVTNLMLKRLVREPGVSVTVVPFLLDENHFDMEAVGAAADASEDVIVVTPETPEGDEGER